MDAGAYCHQVRTPIGPEETAGELAILRVAAEAQDLDDALLVELLDDVGGELLGVRLGVVDTLLGHAEHLEARLEGVEEVVISEDVVRGKDVRPLYIYSERSEEKANVSA